MGREPIRAVERVLPAPIVRRMAAVRRAAVDRVRHATPVERLATIVLRHVWPGLVADHTDGLERHEARWMSQHGEDGIVAHLLTTVGATTHRFLEIGAGDGRECGAGMLARHFGWSGVFVDSDAAKIDALNSFYGATGAGARVVGVREWVTAENVNRIVAEHGLDGEIDLLTIDIDGNELWVWRALEQVSPRVVVVEYHPGLGSERSVTIPYDPAFDRFAADPLGFFRGASLAALDKLARAKGYVLAGCDSSGTNAFFVRTDIGASLEVDVATAFRSPSGEDGQRTFLDDFRSARAAGYVEY